MAYSKETGEEEIISLSLSGKDGFPAIWIFDVLSTTEAWINAVKEKNTKVVCFDDEGSGLQKADMVINGIVHAWGNYRSEDVSVRLLEGAAYAIINSSALKHRRLRAIEKRRGLSVGISLGGSDPSGHTLRLAAAVSLIENSGHTYHIFTGPHFIYGKELAEIAESSGPRIVVKHFVSDLHAEMDKMDVSICNGGLTLFEVCAMGLPALALANVEHEENTIRHFTSINACRSLGAGVRVTEGALSKKISEYLDDTESLDRIAESNYKMFRENGAYNSARAVMGLLDYAVN